MSRFGQRQPPRDRTGTAAPAAGAYAIGLKLLARRELSTAQLRATLLRRRCEPPEVEDALERLTREGALDDARTARAFARTAITLKAYGRDRILRELRALGIDRELAGSAVGEALEETSDEALLEQAIARRVKAPIRDERELRRLHGWFLRRGFPPERVRARLLALSEIEQFRKGDNDA